MPLTKCGKSGTVEKLCSLKRCQIAAKIKGLGPPSFVAAKRKGTIMATANQQALLEKLPKLDEIRDDEIVLDFLRSFQETGENLAYYLVYLDSKRLSGLITRVINEKAVVDLMFGPVEEAPAPKPVPQVVMAEPVKVEQAPAPAPTLVPAPVAVPVAVVPPMVARAPVTSTVVMQPKPTPVTREPSRRHELVSEERQRATDVLGRMLLITSEERLERRSTGQCVVTNLALPTDPYHLRLVDGRFVTSKRVAQALQGEQICRYHLQLKDARAVMVERDQAMSDDGFAALLKAQRELRFSRPDPWEWSAKTYLVDLLFEALVEQRRLELKAEYADVADAVSAIKRVVLDRSNALKAREKSFPKVAEVEVRRAASDDLEQEKVLVEIEVEAVRRLLPDLKPLEADQRRKEAEAAAERAKVAKIAKAEESQAKSRLPSVGACAKVNAGKSVKADGRKKGKKQAGGKK